MRELAGGPPHTSMYPTSPLVWRAVPRTVVTVVKMSSAAARALRWRAGGPQGNERGGEERHSSASVRRWRRSVGGAQNAITAAAPAGRETGLGGGNELRTQCGQSRREPGRQLQGATSAEAGEGRHARGGAQAPGLAGARGDRWRRRGRREAACCEGFPASPSLDTKRAHQVPSVHLERLGLRRCEVQHPPLRAGKAGGREGPRSLRRWARRGEKPRVAAATRAAAQSFRKNNSDVGMIPLRRTVLLGSFPGPQRRCRRAAAPAGCSRGSCPGCQRPVPAEGEEARESAGRGCGENTVGDTQWSGAMRGRQRRAARAGGGAGRRGAHADALQPRGGGCVELAEEARRLAEEGKDAADILRGREEVRKAAADSSMRRVRGGHRRPGEAAG